MEHDKTWPDIKLKTIIDKFCLLVDISQMVMENIENMAVKEKKKKKKEKDLGSIQVR